MLSSKIELNIVGKLRNGQEIDKYIAKDSEGHTYYLTREEMIVYGSRGNIKNIRIQVSNGKSIIRGKGIDLNTLPEMNINTGNIRQGKAKETAEFIIVKKIIDKGKLIGYQLKNKAGAIKNISKADTLKLADSGKIKNAKVEKRINSQNNSIEMRLIGINCDLNKVASLIRNDAGQFIDPTVTKRGLSTRALLVTKGGQILDYKRKRKIPFVTGDFLVLQLDGNLKVYNRNEIAKEFTLNRDERKATIDDYVNNYKDIRISILGNEEMQLNNENLKSWTIINFK